MTDQQVTETALTRLNEERRVRLVNERDALAPGARPGAIVPSTFGVALSMCQALAASDLVPKAFKDKPQDMIVVIMSGSELGLAPMQSLRLYHIIEGIPRLSSEGIRSIVMASPLCEYLDVVETSDKRATWRGKRIHRPELTVTWTIERAQRAGLIKKTRSGEDGMWMKYPENMLLSRAGAEICRLLWPDIVAGLISREEAIDGDVAGDFTDQRPAATSVNAFGPTPTSPAQNGIPERASNKGPKAGRVVDSQATERPTTSPANSGAGASASSEAQQQTPAQAKAGSPTSPTPATSTAGSASVAGSAPSPAAPQQPSQATASTSTASDSAPIQASGADEDAGQANEPSAGDAFDTAFGDEPTAPPPMSMEGFRAWVRDVGRGKSAGDAEAELIAGRVPWIDWARSQGWTIADPKARPPTVDSPEVKEIRALFGAAIKEIRAGGRR